MVERQSRAIELRKLGFTYRQIGQQLGVSQVQALWDTRAALADVIKQRQESAAELVAMELEKLGWLESKMAPHAAAGNPHAGMVMLRTSQRRCALLGLDAAQRIELSGGPANPLAVNVELMKMSNEELRARLDRMREAFDKLPAMDNTATVPAVDAVPAEAVSEDSPGVKSSPKLTPEAAAYAIELVQRAARNGNGHNGNGNGNTG
jgi:hypothetical protein